MTEVSTLERPRAVQPRQTTAAKIDRRSQRTQQSLRAALASELHAGIDLSQITVASLTNRANVTRRTFYTHYRDIPDFIEQIEADVIGKIRTCIEQIASANLNDLYANIDQLEPAPGAVDFLQYLKSDGELIGALLGPYGDPAFAQRIQGIARETVSSRMKTGILPEALGTFFDYYLAYVVAAEMGIVQRWFERDLAESPETMARIMTVVAFVRPGDLYGKPIDINVPAYGLKLLQLHHEEMENK